MPRCLLALTLSSLLLGCSRDRVGEALEFLPLDRLEPAVRAQFEHAAVRARQGSAEDLGRMGMLCHCYGLAEQAETWYRQALTVSDSDPRWSHALGLALIELGRPDEAAAAFEAVLRLEPSNSAARLRLAEVDLELGRDSEALERFERVVSDGGANEVHGRAGAGRALVRLGQAERGRDQLEAALVLAPGHASARYALATLLRDEGRLEEAAAQFQRARLDRQSAPPIDDAIAREIDGLATGTTTILQRGMEQRRHATGRADYEAAAALFEEAVRLDPALADAHAELGAVRLALGDTARAVSSLREALRLDPESANALYNLAWIAHREGRVEEALTGFRAAAELRSHDFDVLLGLGAAALRAGDVDEGVSAMRRAMAARPDDPRPYRHLDTHYSETGQEGEAIAVLERGRRALPKDASLIIRLAWHLATAPAADLRDAGRALELARTVARSTDHPRALDTLAAALAASGDYDAAVEVARRAAAGAGASGDAELAAAIRARLLLYESGRAYAR